MQLNLCTISFRHELVSIEQLAQWAQANHFDGIELWGAHAQNLAHQPHYNRDWLHQQQLRICMLSDYLPLFAPIEQLRAKVALLARLAHHWGAKKIRTFAGDRASATLDITQQQLLFARLQLVCDQLADSGLQLVVETHPNTYADNPAAIRQLLTQVQRDNFKLNFDVLHVWESGADITQALIELEPFIAHFHLKNIENASQLAVFAPANVYAAAGSREGMVSLFAGEIDYQQVITQILQHPRLRQLDASLEWFGHHSMQMLAHDRYQIAKLTQQPRLIAAN